MAQLNCGLCCENCPETQPMVQTMDKVFHEKCYVCHQCFQPFQDGVFFTYEDRMYCEYDYWQLYGPRCAFCAVNIVGDCLSVLGRKWHPDHFRCEVCNVDLVTHAFASNSERPLCKPCYRDLAKKMVKKPKCRQCNQDLGNDFLIISGERIHANHFNCTQCKSTLNHLAKEKESKWYCGYCYNKVQFLPVCGGCRYPIEGRSFSAFGKEWHPEHFVCAKCETPCQGQGYAEYKGSPYCNDCFRSIMGETCFVCNRQQKGSDLVRTLNKIWCKEHFTCSACDKNFGDPPKYIEWDNKPMCIECFGTLPRKVIDQLKKHASHERKLVDAKK